MEPLAPRQETPWQPLLDAGLPMEEIRRLVTRLGFEAVVAGPSPLGTGLLDLVGDRPPPVRAAWLETLERITTMPVPGA
ncbi:hypothetical protein [Blastococcus xanthinilyticus]|uniref:Uncharacterized protein n=1 Tax=Blastococcus xanthinilyticus TaxID=1564164 RepID=A0A5S5D2Y3_9ACTN|nr:hypothetical protein [Blastococcus xanthinilyticus]TYP90340.1 hypothetical protein BD833_10158 [Blastococcus xanthinilyticus]